MSRLFEEVYVDPDLKERATVITNYLRKFKFPIAKQLDVASQTLIITCDMQKAQEYEAIGLKTATPDWLLYSQHSHALQLLDYFSAARFYPLRGERIYVHNLSDLVYDDFWKVSATLGAVVVTNPDKASVIIACQPMTDNDKESTQAKLHQLARPPTVPVVSFAWLRACYHSQERLSPSNYAVVLDVVHEPSPKRSAADTKPALGNTSIVLSKPPPLIPLAKGTSAVKTPPTSVPSVVACHDSADKADTTPSRPPKSADLTLQRSTSAPSAATRRQTLAPSMERPTANNPRPTRRSGMQWFAFEADRLSPPPRKRPLKGKIVVVDTTPLRKAQARMDTETSGFEDESPEETDAYLAHVTHVLRELGAQVTTTLHPKCNVCLGRQYNLAVETIAMSQDVLVVSPLWVQAVAEQKRLIDVEKSVLYRPAKINKMPCCISTSKLVHRSIVFDAAHHMGWLSTGAYDRSFSDFLIAPPDADTPKTAYALQHNKPMRTLRWFLRAYASGDVPAPEPADIVPRGRPAEMSNAGMALGLTLTMDSVKRVKLQVGRVTGRTLDVTVPSYLKGIELAAPKRDKRDKTPNDNGDNGDNGDDATNGQSGGAANPAPAETAPAQSTSAAGPPLATATGTDLTATDGEPQVKRAKPLSDPKPQVAFTAVDSAVRAHLTGVVEKLGGKLVPSEQCTHLVVGTPSRTANLLKALCVCDFVLDLAWLQDSDNCGRFVEENSYQLTDMRLEAEFNFKLETTLARQRKHGKRRVFHNIHFYITPNVHPKFSTLVEIVQAGGGRLVLVADVSTVHTTATTACWCLYESWTTDATIPCVALAYSVAHSTVRLVTTRRLIVHIDMCCLQPMYYCRAINCTSTPGAEVFKVDDAVSVEPLVALLISCHDDAGFIRPLVSKPACIPAFTPEIILSGAANQALDYTRWRLLSEA
eukprot:m.161162 g.161162  ORF g.161162 m.161162 type:complete len:930 (+) comp16518_c0_seq3:779-3568(+)